MDRFFIFTLHVEGNTVLVQQLDGPFEAGEFHHRVRYLPQPERRQPFEEAGQALVPHDHRCAAAKGWRRTRGGLDADLNTFFSGISGALIPGYESRENMMIMGKNSKIAWPKI